MEDKNLRRIQDQMENAFILIVKLQGRIKQLEELHNIKEEE